MKLVFTFATLLCLAMAAAIDLAEQEFVLYSSENSVPYTKVSLVEAVAILCRDLKGTTKDCNAYCDKIITPIYACPRLCQMIVCRNNCFGKVAWGNEYDVGRPETCYEPNNITDEAILCTLWVYYYNYNAELSKSARILLKSYEKACST